MPIEIDFQIVGGCNLVHLIQAKTVHMIPCVDTQKHEVSPDCLCDPVRLVDEHGIIWEHQKAKE